MPDPRDLLASDAERERVADSLRTHAAEGRLDHDELGDRIGRAYAARTRGELTPLTADLPAPPVREPRRLPQVSPLIAIAVLLIAIWAFTGMGYFWPVWPIGAMALSSFKHRAPHPIALHRRRPHTS
jgi:hypothetical protein